MSGWFRAREGRPVTGPVLAANFLIALLALAGLFYYAFQQSLSAWQGDVLVKYQELFWRGWWLTIQISAAALVGSTVLGFLWALAGRSSFLPLRALAKVCVELIRGTPLLAQIYIFFYVVANAFSLHNRFIVGILTLSIFSGAYIAEVFRAGIESIGKSQLESAKAIGLTRGQTYRHIIIPQALRVTLPPLAGQFASLIKDSSLLSTVAIIEFTQSAANVAALTYSNLECYLMLAPGYLLLTMPISLWTQWLEKKHRYET
ncbi:MAG TPA: amino acid ABC transporter permease [Chthoniobacterales bacterium]|jgi:polar amino acid transport system permease protein